MNEYLAMLDKMRIAAAVTDSSLNVLEKNGRFAEMFIEADRVLPDSFYAGSVPDFSGVLKGGDETSVANTVLNIKGRRTLCNLRLFRDKGAFIFCAVVSGGDVGVKTSLAKSSGGLREYHNSLNVLVNKVRDMVFIHNDDAVFFANDSALKFLGYPSLESLRRSGRCLCSFFEDTEEATLKDRPEWKDLIASGLLKGFEKKVCIRCAVTGDLHYFITDTVKTGKADDEFISVFTDITDLDARQKQYEASESKFREMFFGHSAPMLIIDNENSGKIMEANTASCLFYGYAKDELVSMSIDQLNIMPAEAIKKEMDHARSRARNYFNFIHRLKDGNVKNVEVYSAPIDYNGKTVLCSIILDSTEKKLYEIQLKDMNKRLSDRIYHEVRQSEECENKFKVLAEMVSDAIIVFKAENNFLGRILEANTSACNLFNMQKSDLLSKSICELLSEQERTKMSDNFFNNIDSTVFKHDTELNIGGVAQQFCVLIRKMNADDKVVAVAVFQKRS